MEPEEANEGTPGFNPVKRECKKHGIHASWVMFAFEDGVTPHFCMKCIIEEFLMNNPKIARNYDVPDQRN